MACHKRASNGESGASLIEYILLAASIFLVCLAGIANMGINLGSSMNDTASRVVESTGF